MGESSESVAGMDEKISKMLAARERGRIYSRQYYAKHKEERLEYQGRYNQEHSGERKAYASQYYQDHQEELLARSRRYGEKHKEEVKAFLKSLWQVGILSKARLRYWRLIIRTSLTKRKALPVAVELAIYHQHFEKVAKKITRPV